MDPAGNENVETQQSAPLLGHTQFSVQSKAAAGTSSQPLATPSKLSENGQINEHINALFDQLKSNYEKNANVFREKTQHALQQLEDMEAQLKVLLNQLEDDRDELMDGPERVNDSTSQNVFEATSASD